MNIMPKINFNHKKCNLFILFILLILPIVIGIDSVSEKQVFDNDFAYDIPMTSRFEEILNYDIGGIAKSIDMTPDGKYIVVGTMSGNIFLFNSSGSTPLWSFYVGHSVNEMVRAVISTDGNYIAAGDGLGYVYLFNTSSSTPIWTYDVGLNRQANHIAISDDGFYIVVGTGYYGRVFLFNRTSSTPMWVYDTAGDSNVKLIDISADGNYIIAGTDAYDYLYLFQKSSNIPIWTYACTGDLISADLSADGNYIAVGGGWDDLHLKLIGKSSSTPIWEYNLTEDVTEVYITSNGDFIAAGNAEGNVTLFQKSGGDPMWNYKTTDIITALKISDDANFITFGDFDGLCHIFRNLSDTPFFKKDYGTQRITCIDFSSDTSIIAVGGAYSNMYVYQDVYYPDSFTLSSDAGSPDDDGKFNLIWSNSHLAHNYSVYMDTKSITVLDQSLIYQEGILLNRTPIEITVNDDYYFIIVAFNYFGNCSSNSISIEIFIEENDDDIPLDPPDPPDPNTNSIGFETFIFVLGVIGFIVYSFYVKKEKIKEN